MKKHSSFILSSIIIIFTIIGLLSVTDTAHADAYTDYATAKAQYDTDLAAYNTALNSNQATEQQYQDLHQRYEQLTQQYAPMGQAWNNILPYKMLFDSWNANDSQAKIGGEAQISVSNYPNATQHFPNGETRVVISFYRHDNQTNAFTTRIRNAAVARNYVNGAAWGSDFRYFNTDFNTTTDVTSLLTNFDFDAPINEVEASNAPNPYAARTDSENWHYLYTRNKTGIALVFPYTVNPGDAPVAPVAPAPATADTPAAEPAAPAAATSVAEPEHKALAETGVNTSTMSVVAVAAALIAGVTYALSKKLRV